MPPSEDAISLTGDQGPTKHTNVDSELGKEGFFSPSHRSFLRQSERNLHIEQQLVVTLQEFLATIPQFLREKAVRTTDSDNSYDKNKIKTAATARTYLLVR